MSKNQANKGPMKPIWILVVYTTTLIPSTNETLFVSEPGNINKNLVELFLFDTSIRKSIWETIKVNIEASRYRDAGYMFYPEKRDPKIKEIFKQVFPSYNFYPLVPSQTEEYFLKLGKFFPGINSNNMNMEIYTSEPLVNPISQPEVPTELKEDQMSDKYAKMKEHLSTKGDTSSKEGVSFFAIKKGGAYDLLSDFNLEELNKHLSAKRGRQYLEMINSEDGRKRFHDLIAGDNTVPDRIKKFYGMDNAIFKSLLIIYSSHNKTILVEDMSDRISFLLAPKETFINLNDEYELLPHFDVQRGQEIKVEEDDVNMTHNVMIDKEKVELSLRRIILATFTAANAQVKTILHTLAPDAHQGEYHYLYDRMTVIVKFSSKKYTVEDHHQ